MIGKLVEILKNDSHEKNLEIGRVVGVAGDICSIDFKDWKGGHSGFEGKYERTADILPIPRKSKQYGRWNFKIRDVRVIQEKQLEFNFDV